MPIRITLISLCLALLYSCSTRDNDPDGFAQNDTSKIIWFGGPIITMEQKQPRAEAVVSESGGQILFVGSLETTGDREEKVS